MYRSNVQIPIISSNKHTPKDKIQHCFPALRYNILKANEELADATPAYIQIHHKQNKDRIMFKMDTSKTHKRNY